MYWSGLSFEVCDLGLALLLLVFAFLNFESFVIASTSSNKRSRIYPSIAPGKEKPDGGCV